jgi:hypothetical protein
LSVPAVLKAFQVVSSKANGRIFRLLPSLGAWNPTNEELKAAVAVESSAFWSNPRILAKNNGTSPFWSLVR